MRTAFSKGILSAAAVAYGCAFAQAQNVYRLGIHSAGTTYYQLCDFSFVFAPRHYKLTEINWYQDARGFHIIDAGHERERGGILHRSLEVDCGTELFRVPLGPDASQPVLAGTAADQLIVALVMETGYPERPATLTAILDGSAGLYLTNGGRIIREGQNPKSSAAARKLLAQAAEVRSDFAVAREFPFAQKWRTRFYIITWNGVLTSDAEEAVLRTGEHRMSALFKAAQTLLAELQLGQEKGGAEPAGAANGSQPIRSETNRTSPAAGSRR